jgi:hypothetical protein
VFCAYIAEKVTVPNGVSLSILTKKASLDDKIVVSENYR